MSVRLPAVRQSLLRDLSTLRRAAGEINDVVLGDVVEEVWHLLDPSHGGEPGDILRNDAEVALGTEVVACP
jgi:hypothetical protein